MASVYRMKRKSKEEVKTAPVKNPELLTDLNLSTASAPTEARADKVEPLAEVTRREIPEIIMDTGKDEIVSEPIRMEIEEPIIPMAAEP